MLWFIANAFAGSTFEINGLKIGEAPNREWNRHLIKKHQVIGTVNDITVQYRIRNQVVDFISFDFLKSDWLEISETFQMSYPGLVCDSTSCHGRDDFGNSMILSSTKCKIYSKSNLDFTINQAHGE